MNLDDRYIREVLLKNSKLSVDMIKKDLILSYILQELASLEDLVFKGGTCLSKCYLNYHRLSEDLDFNLELGKFDSKTKHRRAIREYFKDVFLVKLQEIASKYNLDFDKDEFSSEGVRYCPVKSGDNVFVFYVYFNVGDRNPIKVEVNISEDRLFDSGLKKVGNLDGDSKYLVYPLRDFKINCYSLYEIILEKIRAILTRPEGIHERDIFDLFLINNLQDVFAIEKKNVLTKLKKSFLFDLDSVLNRVTEVESYVLFEEVDNLALIDFDRDKYVNFFNDLKYFICELKL